MGWQQMGREEVAGSSWQLIQGCFDGASEEVKGWVSVFEMDRVGSCSLQDRAPLEGKSEYAEEGEGRAQMEGVGQGQKRGTSVSWEGARQAGVGRGGEKKREFPFDCFHFSDVEGEGLSRESGREW